MVRKDGCVQDTDGDDGDDGGCKDATSTPGAAIPGLRLSATAIRLAGDKGLLSPRFIDDAVRMLQRPGERSAADRDNYDALASSRIETQVAEHWLESMQARRCQDAAQENLVADEADDLTRSTLSREFHLPHSLIDRLLRSFFIYTVGLHDTLRQAVRHCNGGALILVRLWESYLSLLENADRPSYEAALGVLDDVDQVGGEQDAMQARESALKAKEASTAVTIQAMEDRLRQMENEGGELQSAVEEIEEAVRQCASANHNLALKRHQLEVELREWAGTSHWHREHAAELQRVEMRNLGALQILQNKLAEMVDRDTAIRATIVKLHTMIGDLNLRMLATNSAFEMEKRRWTELKRRVEDEAQSKQTFKEIIVRQEQQLAAMRETEVEERRDTGHLEAHLQGQRAHNADLRQSIVVLEDSERQMQGVLDAVTVEHDALHDIVRDKANALIALRHGVIQVDTSTLTNEQLHVKAERLAHARAAKLQEILEEIDDHVREISKRNDEDAELQPELARSAAERATAEAMLVEYTIQHETLQRDVASSAEIGNATATALSDLTVRLAQETVDAERFAQQYAIDKQRLVDAQSNVSQTLSTTETDAVSIALQAETLSNERIQWTGVVEAKEVTLRKLLDEIAETQRVCASVDARDEEQRALCDKIDTECQSVEGALPAVNAELAQAEAAYAQATRAFDARIFQLQTDIINEQEAHRQAIEDVAQCRRDAVAQEAEMGQQLLAMERDDVAFVEFERHRLAKIKETIAAADCYLEMIDMAAYDNRAMIKEITEINAALDECLRADRRTLERSLAEEDGLRAKLKPTTTIEQKEAKAVEQVRRQYLGRQQHMNLLERDRERLQRQVFVRRKVSVQRSLELENLEAYEWRLRRNMNVAFTQLTIIVHDREVQTDTVRKKGAREQLQTAPILVGMSRTFDASMVVQQYPKPSPRSIRLKMHASEDIAPDDFKTIPKQFAPLPDESPDSARSSLSAVSRSTGGRAASINQDALFGGLPLSVRELPTLTRPEPTSHGQLVIRRQRRAQSMFEPGGGWAVATTTPRVSIVLPSVNEMHPSRPAVQSRNSPRLEPVREREPARRRAPPPHPQAAQPSDADAPRSLPLYVRRRLRKSITNDATRILPPSS